MTYEELEKKILSMSAKEIILSMVDGIKNPVTKIDMYSFGDIQNGVCFGCAATNMICKIGDLNPRQEIITKEEACVRSHRYRRGYCVNLVIDTFETAIDFLRSGNLFSYNALAEEYDFATIQNPEQISLPVIDNDNYKDENVLNAYIELANKQ